MITAWCVLLRNLKKQKNCGQAFGGGAWPPLKLPLLQLWLIGTGPLQLGLLEPAPTVTAEKVNTAQPTHNYTIFVTNTTFYNWPSKTQN